MQIIALLNQKGGVGKTSTCHHLAGTLALMGRRVLLVDNDPQASLTQGFLGPAITGILSEAETVAALYAGRPPFPEDLIRPSGVAGVDLIPGSELATGYNVPWPQNADGAAQRCLAEFLAEVRGYDLALIDCPPNLHLCSWAALVTAGHILIPLQAEDYGSQGVVVVGRSVAMVQAGPNPGLRVLGYLLTMVSPRRSLHQLYEQTIRSMYGDLVLDSRVTYQAAYAEAIAARKPIAQHKPKGAPAREIRALADEILARLDRPDAAAGQGEAA